MDCAYVRFDSEANRNNTTKKSLVIGNTLVYWVLTDAKKCHFCYQVGHLVSKCPILHKKKEGNTITSWSNKLTDSKGEQDCRVIEIIKEEFNFKEQIE
ncbi:hypothetical protein G9A89_015643 [Geosiphon pyriformis]|nr:hypothetical protein G9A89_015643 [Geosiphon pyriformis]